MTATKRTKNSRYRGSKTHGCGSMKKRRGAGNRGGRGNAGTGKRGDANKPKIWKNKKYFGKHGFKKKNIPTVIKSINIRTIVEILKTLLSNGLAEEKGGVVEIQLEKVGYNKLLSTGTVTQKLKIMTPFASAKAIEKVKAAGGEVVVTEGDVFEPVESADAEETVEAPAEKKAETAE